VIPSAAHGMVEHAGNLICEQISDPVNNRGEVPERPNGAHC
jgi:hypothetical protein